MGGGHQQTESIPSIGAKVWTPRQALALPQAKPPPRANSRESAGPWFAAHCEISLPRPSTPTFVRRANASGTTDVRACSDIRCNGGPPFEIATGNSSNYAPKALIRNELRKCEGGTVGRRHAPSALGGGAASGIASARSIAARIQTIWAVRTPTNAAAASRAFLPAMGGGRAGRNARQARCRDAPSKRGKQSQQRLVVVLGPAQSPGMAVTGTRPRRLLQVYIAPARSELLVLLTAALLVGTDLGPDTRSSACLPDLRGRLSSGQIGVRSMRRRVRGGRRNRFHDQRRRAYRA